MSNQPHTCPMTRQQVVDQYFLEHRAKMIDIAAFFDRIERAQPTDDVEDFRVKAMKEALALLTDGEGERADRDRRQARPSHPGAHAAPGRQAQRHPHDARRDQAERQHRSGPGVD